MGAFLHDAAKVDELSYERDIAYTDEGQLLGHMVLGVTMIDDKVRQVVQQDGQPFPERLLIELKHLIVSHHGQYEYGSPKLPMTLEAIALHLLDNLDAKMANFTQLMTDCPNIDSNWTQYFTQIGRKLFKAERRGLSPGFQEPLFADKTAERTTVNWSRLAKFKCIPRVPAVMIEHRLALDLGSPKINKHV